MSVKSHYDKHLSEFYSWMIGDIKPRSEEFKHLLFDSEIRPADTKTALDLGAGHGVQSIALKSLGYQVTAVDFNQRLLNELLANPDAHGINTVLAEITELTQFQSLTPELIICCGDTITHLESKTQIEQFLGDTIKLLEVDGHLILTFRDYSKELNDSQRFIPVKSSANRILTCILEYCTEKVKVSDLLYERIDGTWTQKVSSYEKTRIASMDIENHLEGHGMKIKLSKPINGVHTIIAQKNQQNR